MFTPATQIRWSLLGSMRTWLKYIGRGLVLLILTQFSPLSSLRQIPDSSLSTSAYTTFGFRR